MNLRESGREAWSGVGAQPCGLIGSGRFPVGKNSKTVERILRRFDRAVSRLEVGLVRPVRPRNHRSNKLNEHGSALNVFWPRHGGVGAREKKGRKDQDRF